MNKISVAYILFFFILASSNIYSQKIKESDFKTDKHPRIFITTDDKDSIKNKIRTVKWAQDIYESLKKEVDPIVHIHNNNPSYVISRMQMHWEEGQRYTRFYTDKNFITRREGDAKYPTVRLTYGRAASNSVPIMPLDKIIPYGNGALTKPSDISLGIVDLNSFSDKTFYKLGTQEKYDTIPFTRTGLGTETVNRNFIHLAWKSSILYYLSNDKKYAKLSADILWNFIRGAAQQEQVNPDWERYSNQVCINGYLSFETLGDTRHFATIPLTYDMIYNYLRDEYFDSDQFINGIKGEIWAPPHPEGKEWALKCFEIMFKRLIENKLNRGGGLKGNWNMNEQQSAMLYALALDNDSSYIDKKGRAYYVNKLVYGPTTPSHGAYTDVLRANISPVTGLWPEAPGGYGQGSSEQLIRFGYIYYKNGLDLLSNDTLLNKVSGAMSQMLFPNGYITNIGDASYSKMRTSQLELMMSYAKEKGDSLQLMKFASLMKYCPQRNFYDEFYSALFFYLPEIPHSDKEPQLPRTSYSSIYSSIFERNNAPDYKNALAFTLSGFGRNMGHNQPNGMTIELYGRGHILAPDQGIGQDYWSEDTQEYKINVAAHNTVSPNGKGADIHTPQELKIIHSEPLIVEGADSQSQLSDDYQFVDVSNHFYTNEIKAEQRRSLSIVRTGMQNGYFIDIFRSKVVEGKNCYHDYIYHNMGTGSTIYDTSDHEIQMSDHVLDSLSGKGYKYFKTIGSKKENKSFYVDFNFGIDDIHMRMHVTNGKNRTIYQLNSLFNHRYYIPDLRKLPVPTCIIRQEGEAWEQPFIVVYEPYGNGVEALIQSICTEKTCVQEGIAKFSVNYKQKDKKDYIIHSVNPKQEARYKDIKFKGTFAIISIENGKLMKAYIINGYSLFMKGISIKSANNKPFNMFLEWKDNAISYDSDEKIIIRTTH